MLWILENIVVPQIGVEERLRSAVGDAPSWSSGKDPRSGLLKGESVAGPLGTG